MSCDKLVFDLAQEVEGSPNVFIRKDWINILDNQNQNYQNNQSIIDTSQLANSNKYMSYREAYLAIPMLLSVRGPLQGAAPVVSVIPNDYCVSLKNWFGTIIHSFTLDYNGTTIVQQTPFCNIWNSFKLLTSLSWGDVATQGSSIGFYPDVPDSFQYFTSDSTGGCGILNNDMGQVVGVASKSPLLNQYTQASVVPGAFSVGGNSAATIRTKWIAYNPGALVGTSSFGTSFLSTTFASQIWKSNVSRRQSSDAEDRRFIYQISIMATVYLKHIHSFFNMVPLLKGVFMKMTMNLNNSQCTVTTTAAQAGDLACTDSTVYVGGVQPILVPSSDTGGYLSSVPKASDMYYDLVVGSQCYNSKITSTTGGSPAAEAGNVSKSVYLYVPAYTFNPTFEQAYLSSPVKQIKYTDIYQYQFDILASGSSTQTVFNQLITNGIANIKSVLIVPFYSTKMAAAGGAVIEYISPFSTAGGGTTAPMATFTNFNIQISGQNAIYNMQRYGFEEFNNQLYGQFAVNGGLTDGLTSGLIDFAGFQSSYSYYYVNVERMLPVEQSVPKSVQVLGTSMGIVPIRCLVFVEYGVQVAIDVLTGARV